MSSIRELVVSIVYDDMFGISHVSFLLWNIVLIYGYGVNARVSSLG